MYSAWQQVGIKQGCILLLVFFEVDHIVQMSISNFKSHQKLATRVLLPEIVLACGHCVCTS